MSKPSPANGSRSSLPVSLNEDLYTLHTGSNRHWWTCTVCSVMSGSYTTKGAARRSAERHAEKLH